MTKERPNANPDEHNEWCDHDRPLLDETGKPFVWGEADGPSKGTCAECGAKDCCVGCRSSDDECYCDPE